MAAADPQPRSPCVPDRTFELLFSGARLPERDLAEIDRHADQCEECAERLADFGYYRGANVRAAAGGNAIKRGPLEAGKIFAGRYRVEALLGSGGMGTIVRAFDLRGKREVALKLMRPERIGDATALVRFTREARATMSLESPNAVRVFDIGDDLDAPYLVMECLRGRDIARIVAAEGALSPLRAVDYALQALNALGEAHQRGIIHRDIKPQNLFVTDEGVVKVLDFGLAKLLPTPNDPSAGASHATRTNVLLGSPRYMSPEQIATPREIDGRADIWSLGASMFHMLTARPPFLEKNLLVLATRIFSEKAPRISSVRADVPPSVERVIAKCMERERGRRYRDVAAFQSALRAVAEELRGGGGGVNVLGATFNTSARDLVPVLNTAELPSVVEEVENVELTIRMDMSAEVEVSREIPRLYSEDEEGDPGGKGGTVVIGNMPNAPATRPTLDRPRPAAGAAASPAKQQLGSTLALGRPPSQRPPPMAAPAPPVAAPAPPPPRHDPPIPPVVPPFRDLQGEPPSPADRRVMDFPPQVARTSPLAIAALVIAVIACIAAYPVAHWLGVFR